MLCYDVCALSFDEDGRPLAWPGLPRLKLWRDAADRLGDDTSALDRAVDGHDKYHVPIGSVGGADPVRFARLYLLGRAEDGGGEPRVERLRGGDAVRVVMRNSHRVDYVERLGLAVGHFAACAAVARRAGVFAAHRRWGYDVFDKRAGALVAYARSEAA